VLNGNWAIQWSGEYSAAGSSFVYRRQDAATPELITAVGPLQEPIDLMVTASFLSLSLFLSFFLASCVCFCF